MIFTGGLNPKKILEKGTVSNENSLMCKVVLKDRFNMISMGDKKPHKILSFKKGQCPMISRECSYDEGLVCTENRNRG